MAIKEAPTYVDTVYQGEHGNASSKTIALNLDAAVDDEILVIELPIGLVPYGLRQYHEDLGSGSRLDVYIGDVHVGEFHTGSEGSWMVNFFPIYITEPGTMLKLVPNTADVSGHVDITIDYVSYGY